MDKCLQNCKEDSYFSGPWIRKEEMKSQRNGSTIKTNVLPKMKDLKITNEELTAFSISSEEWNRLVEDEEKAEKIRQHLLGVKMEYDKINQECSARMPPPAVLEEINKKRTKNQG
ncbi:hypothetical protein RCL_jg22550.t1 [Rhizophagus clarus]|nr:hypothetical protein RCL_jg22550.t1 [Rhizophagus clarus]